MKLERAKQRMNELGEELKKFFRKKPYQFSGKPNPAAGEVVYTMDVVKPIPPEIPLIAGEIIQNLRSALDHLAYSLAGTSAGKKTAFPIAESKSKYGETNGLRSSRTGGMPTAAITAIDAIQPYKGGAGDVLWRINELNNIDKHRLVLTVGSAIHSVNFGSVMAQHMRKKSKEMRDRLRGVDLSLYFSMKDNCYPLEVGTEVFRDKTTVDPMSVPIRFEIVLYETGIVEGK